ncbi:MAG: ATP-binding cassette domain-containing protein [Microbacterium sp.]|uniref:metal ABC transporter ATP-binding protein n=1 Tax=Microbacterium sp. TaxID=51671 RepID=UPI001AC3F2C5|nr:ATP-binding cassette domain-containing protein [Microbacterium sp.]MBN9177473.1 ATP-binding cassette domain-containing protein [Microbacterium sp.]
MSAAPDPTGPVLELADAAISTRDKPIFDHLDLSVAPGDFIVILGPNGAGKTTLFRAILGLDHLDRGSVRVLGEPARRGDRRIGYVPQQRIIPRGAPLTGRDLVTLGRTGTRFGLPLLRRGDKAAIDKAIAAVGGEHLARRPIGDLSGGEQQRLRVAQAIVDEPAILLLDEPLSSLDVAHKQGIVDLAIAQQRRGAAVLFISHDVAPVIEVANRALVIRGDGTHWLGAPEDIEHADLHDHPHHAEHE